MPGHSQTVDPPTGGVLDVVRKALIDVIGAHHTVDLRIELDTSFDRDLELESIEVVALNERLVDHYGTSIDFTAWLATKDVDEIIGLTVGDLVSFVAASIAEPTA